MGSLNEIGSCEAILAGVATKIDGSVKVTLEINPQDQDIISKLIKTYLLGNKLLQVAFVNVE